MLKHLFECIRDITNRPKPLQLRMFEFGIPSNHAFRPLLKQETGMKHRNGSPVTAEIESIHPSDVLSGSETAMVLSVSFRSG